MTLGIAPGSSGDEAGTPAADSFHTALPLSAHSRFVQRLRRRYEAELALLPPGAPRRDAMQQAFEALRARGLDLPSALRVLRQLVMHRLIHLDCDAGATLADVTRAVTELAELALDKACQQARQEHERQARQQELLGDHLVIGGEDVRPDEAELVMVLGLGSVVSGRCCRRHLCPRQGAGGAAGCVAGCAVWSWLLTHV